MKTSLLVLFLSLTAFPAAALVRGDELPVDTLLEVEQVLVTAPLKQGGRLRSLPLASTGLGMRALERGRVSSLRELSQLAPNFFVPDYGSRMTSSIYVRGMGTRIDQPVVGFAVDGVPYLNKNNYDSELFDIQRIDVLRGPQSTLYGRNAMGGMVLVRTLSPLVWQGTRAGIEYGSGNTLRLRAATYYRAGERLGLSAAAYYRHSDGFFRNDYDGSLCDGEDGGGGRVRVQWLPSERWSVDNALAFGVLHQGGYPYAHVDAQSGEAQGIAYNDECSYRRTTLTEGLTLRRKGERAHFSGVVSYQYTDDRMLLDQDFLPLSYFTLMQAQREHAATVDLVLRRAQQDRRWEWMAGAFGFYKHLDMEAPVRFKRDGIEELILKNANEGLHHVFPDESILIREQEFDIASDFRNPTWGAALYHQSLFRLGRWRITAALRFDFERSALRYDSRADIHYRFTMTMPDYKLLETRFAGRNVISFSELLPRLAVQYTFPRGSLYLSASKGYKAGGFNTQLFSDILQNLMMKGMMTDIGVEIGGVGDANYDTAAATRYKPEYSWNYEAGAHFDLAGGRLRGDVALFYIDCRDQQLTVFPPGRNTGRMMTNAGRTRSCGAEASLAYVAGGWRAAASYGFTDARFVRFDDGKEDYAGRSIPYAPRHTLSLSCAYDLVPGVRWLDRITPRLSWRGAGPIYWNERNDVHQPFYGLLDASLELAKGGLSVTVWGSNLCQERYDTFYFVSIGNAFLQRGKPRRFGLTIAMDF